MLLNLKNIMIKYRLEINGVIHVGGHHGEEVDLYQELKIPNVIFYEPNPECVKILDEKVFGTGYKVKPFGLGNENIKVEFFVASNQGASSSILKPKKHLHQYPYIKFNDKIQIHIYRLDDCLNEPYLYNFMNIDVQGYELEVLQGGKKTLNKIDGIICEVNRDEVYENCPLIGDIDDFLSTYSFVRKETSWDGLTWGDAFYLKEI